MWYIIKCSSGSPLFYLFISIFKSGVSQSTESTSLLNNITIFHSNVTVKVKLWIRLAFKATVCSFFLKLNFKQSEWLLFLSHTSYKRLFRLSVSGEQVRNSAKMQIALRQQQMYAMCTAVNCNYDSGIFSTAKSTLLTIGGSKIAKIHKTTCSCFND